MRYLRALFVFASDYRDSEGQPVIPDNPVRVYRRNGSGTESKGGRAISSQNSFPPGGRPSRASRTNRRIQAAKSIETTWCYYF